MHRVLFAVVLVASFLIAFPAAGQTQGSPASQWTLQGHVLDPMRAPIAGARVTAVPEIPGTPVSATTNERGIFTLPLAPGRYGVTTSASGFLDSTATVIAGSEGTESHDVVLSIAGVREAVTVEGSSGYRTQATASATKTLTPLRDVPQSITVVPQEMMKDQLMVSMGDVVRYVPGMTAHQGENNRDDVVIRGNRSSADFFVNGVRDDVQYYRDLYNLERVEALKGPNAMIFGRGGAGGVINRVTKDATFRPVNEFALQGGMFGNMRVTTDLDRPLNDKVAARLNVMAEQSDSFRDSVDLRRYGFTPSLTVAAGPQTTFTIRYEHLFDRRVADRGITSFQGRPADVDIRTYYGNAQDTDVRARVNLGSVRVEHRRGDVTFRNQTLVGHYGRFYQNYVPGAVNATKSAVTLTAYNNATDRTNVFNQTDIVYTRPTGAIRHTVVLGAEVGGQFTDNFRNSGFFNGTATSLLVPYENPTTVTPVTYRQNATDADNHLTTSVAAVYAQDQVELSRRVQLVGGLRFDRFSLQYHNNRNGDTLERPDNLLSPRVGVVYKPATPLSLYGTYSVSYLPSSGDQFSSLTNITQQVEPERFNNYEVGAKWDVLPDLALTTAVYRLDRTNTRSTDPNDPTRIIQTGSQRTNGYELGVNGRIVDAWTVAGGYAYQDAFVSSATAAAAAGQVVGQVPHHTVSLWNNLRVHPRLTAGLGIVNRSDMFAAIDNTVTLPGYTRADAAAFVTLSRQLRLQVNVENVFDTQYYLNADSNTNISPGAPRAVRVGLTAAF